MNVIAIANQKGGCGKTTTAINLSAALTRIGEQVLLIDMDPQGHASLGLGQSSDELPGLYEIFRGEVSLHDAICRDITAGIDLIPANILLAAVEHLLGDRPERERQLLDLLSEFGDEYSYAVLDCPPSLGLLSVNALRAADQILCPVDSSLYSLDGIERLRETVQLLEENYNVELPILLLPTMFDMRTRLARKLLKHFEEELPVPVCETAIRQSIKVREAAILGVPMMTLRASAAIALDYLALAEEISQTITPRASHPPARDAQRSAPNLSIVTPVADIEPQEVVFNFENLQARRVQVAGDFNDWVPDSGVETRLQDGTTQKVLHVKPGAYEYRLIIDGVWQHDPDNPDLIPNAMGSNNSLLKV
jgi:chromosome partitioning protein